MKRIAQSIIMLAAALLLTGCSMSAPGQLYRPPKRSDDYNNLQAVIDQEMTDLEYCAPLTGENQQTVQMADLDGDGLDEYLVFAKGTNQRPLRIFILDEVDSTFQLVDVLESNGSAFDLVEYVQMDNQGGVELVVGRQLSDQLIRTVSVYSFSGGQGELLLSANYSKFVTVDLDMDSKTELLILRPGQMDTDNGIAELYGVENGQMERSNEVDISGPVDHLKRILVGQLNGGETAVYAANAVSETAIVTDVLAWVDGFLSNVSFSNESGTSVKTSRNYYVYADDIDSDGIVELPYLITMQPVDQTQMNDQRHLIRWYGMQVDGSEVVKLYTYHDFIGGWYLELGSRWAPSLTTQLEGNTYHFCIWGDNYQKAEKVFSIYTLTGKGRDEISQNPNQFVLLKTDTVTYAASLEPAAAYYGISQESIIRSFRLIQQDWKTGET